MISREEAEAIIRDQLENTFMGRYKDKYSSYTDDPNRRGVELYHYGKCDLVDLLDAIYGELPEKNGLSRLKG